MTKSPQEIVESLKNAGVVGAGGAGFPTHVKAAAKADTVIVNGAECEPLLHKDKELLKRSGRQVVDGLELMMRATGASEGIVAVKAKYKEVVSACRESVKGRNGVRVHELADFYPAGDEFTLVYEVTGRLIPSAGLPIQVGVVVDNVETLLNAANAHQSPVVDSYLTVAGAVRRPCSVRVPVGTSFQEVLGLAGGATVPDPVMIDGGAMMGRVAPFTDPVKKTSGGMIVLPKDHPLVWKKTQPREIFTRIGRSACDQCTFCSEFCPRGLLGHALKPHLVMRALGVMTDEKLLSEWGLLCCECSACSLYACPEALNPREACIAAKSDLRTAGITWANAKLNTKSAPVPHEMREYRKIPISRLEKRLGLEQYHAYAPLDDADPKVSRVRIALRQHVGVPCSPLVKAGDAVRRGQPVGEVPAGKLGAPVHASIDGVVTAVDDFITIEKR